MTLELRIQITKGNRQSIFRIIDEILENEDQNPGISIERSEAAASGAQALRQGSRSNPAKDLLSSPPDIPNLPDPGPLLTISPERERTVGSWGHFNSFFPVIAACRVAINLTGLNRVQDLRLDRFVDLSIACFDRRNLKKLRGFPTSRKDSARGRYVWHFIVTASEMGLLKLVSANDSIWRTPHTLKDWDKYSVEATLKGLGFAQLTNDVFDNGSDNQVLSTESSSWLINHLASIDALGYKEYSMLCDVYHFLRDKRIGREELKNWFVENRIFRSYIETWSRKLKQGGSEDGMKQLSNMANLFAASKVALLRELSVVAQARGPYVTINQLCESRGAGER